MSDPVCLAFAGSRHGPANVVNSAVHVISPNALAREGLRQIIESQGISVASSVSAVEDISWSDEHSNDLVLIDLAQPDEQIHALEQVVGNAPGARAIVLAEAFNLEAMTHCLRHGAFGYLVKTMPIASLVSAMDLAASGGKVLPSELADLVRDHAPFVADLPTSDWSSERVPLSHREFDVLCCLMAGYPNKVIARQLDITEATIKVHVKAILRKLKVINRTQAAIWAAAHGLPSHGGGRNSSAIAHAARPAQGMLAEASRQEAGGVAQVQ